ncbi:hypothetical protein L917_05923 [Phytophthora nicotianae]|uniref:Uncharacterized protein n=1 Tax=Phytophthora nicotianae TaxID=4792 RepID=W2LIW8_PHYNI|nr:hypothetical protein L917_05923 [Phytophthora nicotianae]
MQTRRSYIARRRNGNNVPERLRSSVNNCEIELLL